MNLNIPKEMQGQQRWNDQQSKVFKDFNMRPTGC